MNRESEAGGALQECSFAWIQSDAVWCPEAERGAVGGGTPSPGRIIVLEQRTAVRHALQDLVERVAAVVQLVSN